MVGNDDDEELLAQLGVVAANPGEYERIVLAQAYDTFEKPGGQADAAQDVEAARLFLRENDSPKNAAKNRILGALDTLETEIAAVKAAFDLPPPEDENCTASVAGKNAKKGKSAKKGKDVITLGNDTVHVDLLAERLKSLFQKRTLLRGKLKALEASRAPQNGEDVGQSERQKGQGSSSGSKPKEGTRRQPPKLLSFVEDDDFDKALDAVSMPVETERERLVRMGVITPFTKVGGLERRIQAGPSTRTPAPEQTDDDLVSRSIANATASLSAINKARPSTRLVDSSELPKEQPHSREFRQLRTPFKRVTADEKNENRPKPARKRKRPQAGKKWKQTSDSSDGENGSAEAVGVLPEDNKTERRGKRRRLRSAVESNVDTKRSLSGEDQEPEAVESDEEGLSENHEDVVLEGGLRIPGAIYSKLFDYQRTGVKWMWELHCQKAGGIIGDEMGLGKTVQVVAFLAALHNSGMYDPSIVVCPVTLLRQWKREVRKWYPTMRVSILHESAEKLHSRKSKKHAAAGSSEEANTSGSDEEVCTQSDSERGTKSSKAARRWSGMISNVTKCKSGLLLTTYEQLRLNRGKLLDINWGYAILDEGHRIRNPDAEVTLVCKQLQTVHRLIMTGAPIQNKLNELWSLFDFVFPGKLGVLPIFQAQFALPIQIGGYANATALQVSTAYKCAVVLRDLILPYLLRRMKADVNAHLTKKLEHVLFCHLSKEQLEAYRAFLASSETEQIMEGRRNLLYGIDVLRKICNHPDLLEREHGCGHPDYGNPERSGKLKLVAQILEQWKRQGHRVLLFSQTQQMLDILQTFAESQGYEYRRMDGSTAVRQRMALIDEFNQSDNVFLFILTTKVGGLGTNLTGANRVIIFDPDWNPSTDMQARERAWRIGQKKDVTIYRLITRGTIEEKIYHRQIYKHFLTDKILKDPQQRRIFKARDMRDLFTLHETSENIKTETATLFGTEVGDIVFMDGAGANSTNTPTNGIASGRMKSNEGETAVVLAHALPSEDVEGKEKMNGKEIDGEEESRILQDLFESNGIHSAMNHDAILAVSNNERVLVDQEAGRVAQRAANALRNSRVLRATEGVSVPTWTGRSGEAGAPNGVKPRFGSMTNSRVTVATVSGNLRGAGSDVPGSSRQGAGFAAGSAGNPLTSSDVLHRMRQRQVGSLLPGADVVHGSGQIASANGSERDFPALTQDRKSPRCFGQGTHVSSVSTARPSGAAEGSQIPECRREILSDEIRAFLQQNDGSVPSSAIVEQFRTRVSSREVTLFRQLLKEIASLCKEAGHAHKWVLKSCSNEKILY